nr:pentatricopeptide repeat-containing protein At2g15630, mitochondrial [Ipomoea batatas]
MDLPLYLVTALGVHPFPITPSEPLADLVVYKRSEEDFGLFGVAAQETGITSLRTTFSAALARQKSLLGGRQGLESSLERSGASAFLEESPPLPARGGDTKCGLGRLGVATGFPLFSPLLFDLIMFNALIDGYCANGNVEAYCREGKVEEACKLLDEMKSRGIKPDHISYKTLISGYSRRGDMEDAFRVRDVMLGLGFSPTLHTYNALIQGLCKTKQVYVL